ncbi:helix-turn-helix transcriptional regulator [Kitasatospora sp. NPDC058063]|uniref:helix-turn-helix domain-containing protein n=1 Tax=unclassified Kitasatospora TaxID=2633591 RepID=UPI0036DB24C4
MCERPHRPGSGGIADGPTTVTPGHHRPAATETPATPRRHGRPTGEGRSGRHGLTDHGIADRLYVSLGTVKTHLAAAQLKLDVRDRVEVAARAGTRRVRPRCGPRPAGARGPGPRAGWPSRPGGGPGTRC